jgi:hypothetical protein
MLTVQLLVQNERYARDLAVLLDREGWRVVYPPAPDFEGPGAIVADRRAIERFPALLEFPERVVPIASKDADFLSSLLEHNMRSVVFENDPPGTALLAILGTEIGHGEVHASARPSSNFVVIGSR